MKYTQEREFEEKKSHHNVTDDTEQINESHKQNEDKQDVYSTFFFVAVSAYPAVRE